MNCSRCHTRLIMRPDLAGDIVCHCCGQDQAMEVHRAPVTVRPCGRGHPLVEGRCPTCIKLRGHATPVNDEQRAWMRGVGKR